MAETGREAFEGLAARDPGDVAVLGRELRRDMTERGLRALAAAAVHVAAAAPERMAAVYDAAAAGWLGREAPDAPQSPALEALPMSRGWWDAFWTVATPAEGAGRRYAQQMMELAGELDADINTRMAAAALQFRGVAEAAARATSPPIDVEWLSRFPPASLGYLLSQASLQSGSPVFDPYWSSVVPYLRHMPRPLNYINVEVIQAMPLWALVAGYTSSGLDRVAFGGFLMGQVGHHYSALACAVTLTTAAMTNPGDAALVLDSLLKGWAHGRATRPLTLVSWESLWIAPIDDVRQILQLRPFESRYATTARPGWVPRVV